MPAFDSLDLAGEFRLNPGTALGMLTFSEEMSGEVSRLLYHKPKANKHTSLLDMSILG